MPAAIAWCSAQCHGCANCRFISVSVFYGDCSWYSACPALQQPPTSEDWSIIRSGAPLPLSVLSKLGDAVPHTTWSRPRSGKDPRAKRNELRLASSSAANEEASAQPTSHPWYQPHERMSLAVVLFGKVGSITEPSSKIAADALPSKTVSDGGSSSSARSGSKQHQHQAQQPRLQRLALIESHASFTRHVLAPNPRVRVSCFAHSWNPSLARLITRLYKPEVRKRMASSPCLTATSRLRQLMPRV